MGATNEYLSLLINLLVDRLIKWVFSHWLSLQYSIYNHVK